MQNHPNRLWITVLLLGLAFDLLFWKKAPGISFAIFVALCLMAGFLLLWREGLRPARNSLWLILPIIFLAVMTFIRAESMTTLLNYTLTLFLMAVLALTFLGGRWLAYSLGDYIAGILRLTGSTLGLGMSFLGERRRQQRETGAKGCLYRVWPILRGILMALPIVAIFAALLASADLVFAQRLDDFIALFRLEKLPEYILRGVLILVSAYFLAGVFLHAATKSKEEKLLGVEKPLLQPFLGFAETATVLGSVMLLFAAFVAIQVQYLFGGQANITLEGYTYSEYARRGFSELVTVAFFSLLLLLGLSAITRRDTAREGKAFSALGGGLVLLVLVILASAFQRLLLYEEAYGFSRLRTYTHVFMIWLGLLLAAVAALEILRRRRAFALVAVLAALGFIVSLNAVNVDAFIVQQNVARTMRGEELDRDYLTTLSEDAVPALVSAYGTPSLSTESREALAVTLLCRSVYRQEESLPWQSFQLSRWKAGRAMRTLEADLKAYVVDDGDWPTTVISPQGQEYECLGGWID